jgi:hypothetical protein
LLDKRAIVDDLHYLMLLLAKQDGLRQKCLRCSVLTEQLPRRGCLGVVPGLRIGEFLPGEDDLVRLNELGANAGPALTFRTGQEFRPSGHDIQALRYEFEAQGGIHPELQWSVSLPIPDKQDAKKPIGVLKIDGLEVAPSLLAKPLCENNNVLDVLLRLGDALGANRFIKG